MSTDGDYGCLSTVYREVLWERREEKQGWSSREVNHGKSEKQKTSVFPRKSVYSSKLCFSHAKFESLNTQKGKTAFLGKLTVYQSGVKLIFLVENIHRELNRAALCQPKNK